MATSKGMKSVVICVLILGLVLEQVEAAITCCRSTEARTCYNYCSGSRTQCAGACGCTILDGSYCPPNYPNHHLLRGSGEADATIHSLLQSRTICDSIDNGLGSQDMKFDMELCSNACVRFCNEGAVIPSVGT
ncbi:unnamed protein product [Alopecurus aequalis]